MDGTFEWAMLPNEDREEAMRRLAVGIRALAESGDAVRVTAWSQKASIQAIFVPPVHLPKEENDDT